MLATVAGRDARRPALPAIRSHDVDPGYDRLSPGLPGRLRDRRGRHRHRPLVAGLRRRRLQLLPSRTAWRYDDILNPVQGNGVYDAALAAVRRPEHLEGRRRDRRRAARRRPPVRDRRRIDAQLPALLAPQDAGDLPRRGAVVRPHGRGRRACSPRTRRRKTLREMALDAIEETSFYPGERPGAPARHDRQPARLVHQPPAQLGRAAAVLPAQGHAASCIRDTLELLDRAADIVEQGGIEAWSRLTRRRRPRRRGDAPSTTPRATTSSTSGSTRARPSSTVLRGSRTRAPRHETRRPRPTSTSKATTSTAAGSTRRC